MGDTTRNNSGVVQRVRHFLEEDLWQPLPTAAGVLQIYGWPLLRMAVLTAHGCRENRCALRASALTLYSLLALVPTAAMAFGVAQGFGFEQRLQAVLMEHFAGQEEVLQYVIGFARKLLENTRGGVVAGIGVAALFWAVVKVLGHIESALNHIWKVSSRTWERRMGDYLAVMLMGPLLLITASSATVFLQTQVTAIADHLHLLNMMGPVIALAFKLGPYILMWMLFSLIYVVMPNTRVRLGSGLVAGIFAGTVFQLVQLTYIDLQILVSNYNTVYGSFAALPFFLIWLQLSWLIVLAGAEVAHTHQHRRRLSRLSAKRDLSHRDRQLIAVRLCRAIVHAFCQGRPALDEDQLAKVLEISEDALRAPLSALLASKLLNRVVGADGEAGGLQPGRDPAKITLADVLAALDLWAAEEQPPAEDDGVRSRRGRSRKALDELLDAQTKAPANILIRDI